MLKSLGVNHDYTLKAKVYRGIDVFNYLIHVVSGLDSLALGESQIMGQVRDAFNKAMNINCVGGELEYLFNEVFKIGRRIRAKITFKVFDYANATVDIIRRHLSRGRILLIGTGEIAKDILGILIKEFKSDFEISVAGRSRLDLIKSKYNVNTFHLSRLAEEINSFDAIVTCVSSKRPLIDDALAGSLKKEVVIVDLGNPPNVYLNSNVNTIFYSLEDVSKYIYNKYSVMPNEVNTLYNYVDEEVHRLVDRLRNRWVDMVIRQIYIKADEVRRSELEEAYNEICKFIDDLEMRKKLYKILELFSWSLIKKIHHQHILAFRRLADEGKVSDDVLLTLLNGVDDVDSDEYKDRRTWK